jgi:hypothetical protein
MRRVKPLFLTFGAVMLAIGGFSGATATGARADGTTLCASQFAPASGGRYTVQNNEWDSPAAECVIVGGGPDFTVSSSAIANPTDGPPGGYPSIYAGCHWGQCTKGGLAARPLLLSGIAPVQVTSSWETTEPDGSGDIYDVAYDIWINQTPTTSGAPDGSEVMIWLNHQGSIQPAGAEVAPGVRIGGYLYNVWYGANNGDSDSDIITYQMASPRTEVADLDVDSVIRDAEQRGYTQSSWYLISVEAGFEVWQGGTGLATRYFSVNLAASQPYRAGHVK